MGTPAILDLYRYNVARGDDNRFLKLWTDTSSAQFLINCATNKMLFIKALNCAAIPYPTLPASGRLVIVTPKRITVADSWKEFVVMAGDKIIPDANISGATDSLIVPIGFEPPIQLKKSLSDEFRVGLYVENVEMTENAKTATTYTFDVTSGASNGDKVLVAYWIDSDLRSSAVWEVTVASDQVALSSANLISGDDPADYSALVLTSFNRGSSTAEGMKLKTDGLSLGQIQFAIKAYEILEADY